MVSSWRLATIVQHQAGWSPTLDFTFYAPISILLGCLEVDIALLAASMPIFWPIIIKALQPILVVHEVRITWHRRWGASEEELESASVHSETELNHNKGGSYYKDSTVVESVIPLDERQRQGSGAALQGGLDGMRNATPRGCG